MSIKFNIPFILSIFSKLNKRIQCFHVTFLYEDQFFKKENNYFLDFWNSPNIGYMNIKAILRIIFAGDYSSRQK